MRYASAQFNIIMTHSNSDFILRHYDRVQNVLHAIISCKCASLKLIIVMCSYEYTYSLRVHEDYVRAGSCADRDGGDESTETRCERQTATA